MSKAKKIATLAECKSEFRELFQKLTRQHNFSEAWADIVTILAIAIHQQAYFNPMIMPAELEEHTLPIDDEYRLLEERYMSFVPKYQAEGMGIIAKLYGLAEFAVSHFQVDFLGQLYEELELSGAAQRSSRGEFFTPESVSTLMANLTLSNVDEILEEKGYLTLQEPCVGAGRMVISLAAKLFELGHDPQEILYVEATDVNQVLFNCAYFQLSALDLPGRIIWGNTLSREVQEVRETPQLKLSRFHWEKRPEFQTLKFIRSMEAISLEPNAVEVQSSEDQETAMKAPRPDPPSMPVMAEGSGQLRLF